MKVDFRWYVSWLWFTGQAIAAPLLPQQQLRFMADYLLKYGYSSGTKAQLAQKLGTVRLQDVSDELAVFSNEMIGYFNDNPETLQQLLDLMKQPRCSNNEPKHLKRRRKKRYILNDYQWQFTELTWKFHDPKRLFKHKRQFEMAKRTIANAFNLWSSASSHVLRFKELPSWSNQTADIDIYFARGDHKDFEAFDGTGGIVAHSGYPMDGQVHFDASEMWTINGKKGVDLRYVSTHELGHALGLRHSNNPHAIMHPIYRNQAGIALGADDVLGIRHMYKNRITKAHALRVAKQRYNQMMKNERRNRRN